MSQSETKVKILLAAQTWESTNGLGDASRFLSLQKQQQGKRLSSGKTTVESGGKRELSSLFCV